MHELTDSTQGESPCEYETQFDSCFQPTPVHGTGGGRGGGGDPATHIANYQLYDPLALRSLWTSDDSSHFQAVPVTPTTLSFHQEPDVRGDIFVETSEGDKPFSFSLQFPDALEHRQKRSNPILKQALPHLAIDDQATFLIRNDLQPKNLRHLFVDARYRGKGAREEVRRRLLNIAAPGSEETPCLALSNLVPELRPCWPLCQGENHVGTSFRAQGRSESHTDLALCRGAHWSASSCLCGIHCLSLGSTAAFPASFGAFLPVEVARYVSWLSKPLERAYETVAPMLSTAGGQVCRGQATPALPTGQTLPFVSTLSLPPRLLPLNRTEPREHNYSDKSTLHLAPHLPE
ncbi:hypothetical protein KM043_006573 [Ampulex compressa]|nr:hypothetical protein KM043_006573 [Ampulex compressa]